MCLRCVLKRRPDLSLDNVAFPALKEDKLLSLSKSPAVIRGGGRAGSHRLIKAPIILPVLPHTDYCNGHSGLYWHCI